MNVVKNVPKKNFTQKKVWKISWNGWITMERFSTDYDIDYQVSSEHESSESDENNE